jgi:secondary thiamine-phosphate synthase enzyme
MPIHTTITLDTARREQLIDITEQVADAVRDLGIDDGAVLVASLHTTAAVTVNEGYDPDVTRDLIFALGRMVPTDGYHHAEGNSDSHVKVALLGASQLVPVRDGELGLGQWQRVFFCEFDGPRGGRSVQVTALG